MHISLNFIKQAEFYPFLVYWISKKSHHESVTPTLRVGLEDILTSGIICIYNPLKEGACCRGLKILIIFSLNLSSQNIQECFPKILYANSKYFRSYRGNSEQASSRYFCFKTSTTPNWRTCQDSSCVRGIT